MSASALLSRTACQVLRGRHAAEQLELRLMLAAFIEHAFRLAEHVRWVHTLAELAPALQRLALDLQMRHGAWLAWTDGRRTWFVTGEFPENAKGPSGASVLRTSFYDDDGRLAASATWMLDARGRWHIWDR